jgi:ankyrin repeat protein
MKLFGMGDYWDAYIISGFSDLGMGTKRNNKAYNLVCRGNRKRLRHLLGKHAELRTSDSAMLVYAAIWRNYGMLRWLLERDVSPDSRMGKNGNTPLMQAAADGDIRVIKILLEFGADPNAVNSNSENPLGFAITWQQPDAIRLLVAAGADVNSTVDSGLGRTQLDIAELSEWDDCAEVLSELGGRRFVDLSRDVKDRMTRG